MVIERVERIAAVRANPCADADLIRSGLVALREAKAWMDARHAGLVRQPRDHHINIHNNGWVIELGPDRELTLRTPDATTHTTAPPNQQTAA